MVSRLCKPLKTNSFFLFGARGVGKSTLLNHYFKASSVLSIDLLDDEVFDRYLLEPQFLRKQIQSKSYDWVVIDEVQRIPKLLNTAHQLIEEKKQKFALTGSSSRKLKRGGANLLAGRAFVNSLFPLTSLELKKDFSISRAVNWGTLPKLTELTTPSEFQAYLRSYCLTYIKEEVQTEQLVRNLEPFREFLAVSAQSANKIINYSSISRDVGVEPPTVQTYFQILEETNLGFILPHFHQSIRKSQRSSPKFYFFDNGVQKALEGNLQNEYAAGTSMYGSLFEAFIIQEIYRLNEYFQKDFRLSYFATKNGLEVDLILNKGRKTLLIEIKSSSKIDELEVSKIARASENFGNIAVEPYYLSQDPNSVVINNVKCMHWAQFISDFKSF
jgi:predicted AAA+ superfamily ATPase